MKHALKKLLALLLAFSLLLSLSVWAAPAYGDALSERSTPLHDELTLHRSAHWSTFYSDLRRENYAVYTPGSLLRVEAAFGGAVTGKLTAAEAAAQHEAEGQRVVFGINGDFFDANGTPTGLLVSGGALLSSDGGNYAVGFTAEGGAIIGKPALTITASADRADSFPLAALNKARSSAGGIFAYTYDFNAAHTTGTTEPGVDVVLEPLSAEEQLAEAQRDVLLRAATMLGVTEEELTEEQRDAALAAGTLPDQYTAPAIGGKVWYRVVSVTETAAPTPILPGQLVLSANAKSTGGELALLRALTPDALLSVDISCAEPAWSDVTEAVGGLHLLVENGAAKSGLGSENAPRTAIGVRENGEVVLYTVDGRRSGHSIGSSLNTLAQRMAELGCVTAICLDGGGSTAAIASLPDSETASVLGMPSDNSLRKVSNLLLFLSDEGPGLHTSHVYLDADTPYVLAGSSIPLRAALVDTNYRPMSAAPAISASIGRISGLTYTAPDKGGSAKLTASAQSRSAYLTLTVVDAPDELRLLRSGSRVKELSLNPGERADLSVAAYYHHLPLTASDEQFTWSVSGGVGTVDGSGVFTASLTGGKGSLTVSRGDTSLSIPVSVTTRPLVTIEDFEAEPIVEAGYNTAIRLLEGGDNIRFGKVSLSVAYTGVDAGGAAVTCSFTQPAGYDRLNFSVYGDGSGNTLSLYDSAGTARELCVLDFTGWRDLSVSVDPLTRFTALAVTGTTPAGTLLLDQFVASYGTVIDTDAPIITGTLENGILSATLTDAVDGKLTAASAQLLLDGAEAAFTLTDGALRADLTAALADGKSHRVTLTARDASGNRARMSWDAAAAAETPLPFVDCLNPDGTPHWAGANIRYFYDQGLLSGYDVNGRLYARPDNNMTRAEFAVLLFRYLALDARDYQEADTPYADMGAIDAWAVDAAKAMYVLGIMKGSGTDDGKTYFSPTDTVTRAQAITMLGRLQEKGYAAGDLSAFTDAADVPDWAAQHLKTMVAQGVINGSDGRLNPNAPMTRAQALKILSLMR